MSQQYPMYVMPPAFVQQRRRTPNDVISGAVPGLLGGLQLILWLAIIGLEAVSVVLDPGRGTIYAGGWCSIPFFITWVSMFSYLCCGKSNGCGIYLIVINTISIGFSIALIYFTNEFMKEPCRCYGYLCEIRQWDYDGDWISGDLFPWIGLGCTQRTLNKVPYLKGLLACAVLMLSSSVVFIGVYITASICVQSKRNSVGNETNVTFNHQQGSVNFPRQPRYSPHIARNAEPTSEIGVEGSGIGRI